MTASEHTGISIGTSGGKSDAYLALLEVWKAVPDASMVEVSTHGRVWSHRSRPPGLLAQTPNNKGYLRVRYINDAGKRVTVAVASLVLTVHVGPRPPGMQACHGPGGQTDNRLANVRWDTPLANRRDRYGERWTCPRCRGTGYVWGYDA